MILCVGLSPAWDVTYELDVLRVAEVSRADAVTGRAGGKATNVARVLHALGEDVRLLTVAGGRIGRLFRDDLADAGLAGDIVTDGPETRTTSTFVTRDGREPTVVNAHAVISCFEEVLARASRTDAEVVVVSGSLPHGAPHDGYAVLVQAARARGATVVVDTSGPALASAVRAHPELIKPNHLELPAIGYGADELTAASRLAAEGTDVAVSRGADGMLVCTGGGAWEARPPRVIDGNPTGAGDSVVAALARGRLHGWAWPEILDDAVALAAATVASPVAGDFDEGIHRELRGAADVREVVA